MKCVKCLKSKNLIRSHWDKNRGLHMSKEKKGALPRHPSNAPRSSEKILKDAKYKSYEWANDPVIGESMFREYDLRAPCVTLKKGGKEIPAAINPDGMRVLGQAYGTYARSVLRQNKIVVSNDYRSYSRGLAYAFMAGALSSGVDVIDIGVAITPILFFAQHRFNLPGGAMVTASHNDNGWCGLKLAKDLSSTFEPEDIASFKELTYSGKFLTGAGNYERYNGIKDDYAGYVVGLQKGGIGRRLKVVVSTANGGGGAFLPDILSMLGFDVVKVNCDLDWDFPRFNPNTEDITFLHDLGNAVLKNHADLGIGTDGDGDRMGVVDENGKEVFSDRAGLFMARCLSETVKGKPVVIDVKSTGAYAVDPVLKRNNCDVIFSKTGHSYVKAATHRHDALMGVEKSGHIYLRNGFGQDYDDGCLAAVLFCTLLSKRPKSLSELIAEQAPSFQSPTMSAQVSDDKAKYEIAEKVAAELKSLAAAGKEFAGQRIKEIITINGIRVVLADGSWGLVRASSNQPVLTIVVESFGTRKEMYDIFDSLQERLEKHGVRRDNYDQLLPAYDGESGVVVGNRA